MAQRLVKRLCPDTGTEIPLEGSMKVMIEKEFADIPARYRGVIPKAKSLWGIAPTSECPKGTKGRMAVFEVIEMNKELERVILTDPTEPKVRDVARKQGMLTMREDAIIKSMQKLVPFEEVNTLGGAYDAVEEGEEGPIEEEKKRTIKGSDDGEAPTKEESVIE
ncbi:MAG TPA: hypothetical protein VJ837_06235, partial [Candidatus Paceibacterota bacterium]|nr:hypothetical protein [Candidatus Paceibacterota bacterium]